jgi:hypothetical protein
MKKYLLLLFLLAPISLLASVPAQLIKFPDRYYFETKTLDIPEVIIFGDVIRCGSAQLKLDFQTKELEVIKFEETKCNLSTFGP